MVATGQGYLPGYTARVKTCASCKIDKPLEDFARDSSKASGRRGQCKPCWAATIKARRDSDRGAQAGYQRAYMLKARYGITVEEYERLLEQQGFSCAMCSERCATGKRLAVDHDHTTGAVRGLLCHACNRALGAYERVRDAAETYLHGRTPQDVSA